MLRPMSSFLPISKAVLCCALILAVTGSSARAQSDDGEGAALDEVLDSVALDGAVAAIGIGTTPRAQTSYITLSTGRLVLLRGQRFVVTNEPGPAAVLEDAPPAPAAQDSQPAEEPFADAIWVPGHWQPSAGDFEWVDGAYIEPKAGHAFVPPRWVVVEERYLFFSGFYVPYRVYVLSFFNTYHYSGDPKAPSSRTNRDRGPYWPIGVSGRPVGVSTARSRGPYWPLGLGPPQVFNRTPSRPVGLPPSSRR